MNLKLHAVNHKISFYAEHPPKAEVIAITTDLSGTYDVLGRYNRVVAGFGAQLRHLRESMGVHQTDLARRILGVDAPRNKVTSLANRISQVERSDNENPSLRFLEQLADALGLTLSQFFTRIEALKAQPLSGTVNADPNSRAEVNDTTPVPGGTHHDGFAEAAALTSVAEQLADSFARAVDRLIAARQQTPAARHDAPVRATGGRKVRR